MKELGIAMDFKSQDDKHWWSHLAVIASTICKNASTPRVQQLNDNLAKEPISTQDTNKRATRMLDTKDKKQISSQSSKTIASI